MLDGLTGSKISTISKIITLSFLECSLSPLPILCITICSLLNESTNIILNIALIETPVDNVPY